MEHPASKLASDFVSNKTPRESLSVWFQEALFTRSAGRYFNPLIKTFAPSHGVSRDYQCARVLDIQHHHSNAVTLRIQTPKAWIGFVPGQYVSCEFEINGVRRKRNYSISSSLALYKKTGQIDLTIHRVENGLVSNYVIDELRLDSLFFLADATGEFGKSLNLARRPSESEEENISENINNPPLLMLAAGSGITPIRSLLSSAQYGNRETYLIYSCKQASDHLFQDGFLELASAQNNFHLLLHTTRDKKSDKRIDAALIKNVCEKVADCEVLICGGKHFAEDMLGALKALAVKESDISFESFDHAFKFSGSEKSVVNFSVSNKTLEEKGGVSLLEQAEQLGLSPNSGCRMGVCHTCTCTKKSGLVRNLLSNEISAADEEEIRICISQAVGEVDIAI